METSSNPATQSVTPFLWYADHAEEAINFYMSIFKDSQIVSISRLPDEAPGKAGRMLTATIRIKGLELMILEGGPLFEFTPAISLFVHCAEQEEVDFLWVKFIANGGKPSQCGWLDDKYGVTWQIVPDALGRLMGGPNPIKARAVMHAMMKMIKIDVAGLQKAYHGT